MAGFGRVKTQREPATEFNLAQPKSESENTSELPSERSHSDLQAELTAKIREQFKSRENFDTDAIQEAFGTEEVRPKSLQSIALVEQVMPYL